MTYLVNNTDILWVINSWLRQVKLEAYARGQSVHVGFGALDYLICGDKTRLTSLPTANV